MTAATAPAPDAAGPAHGYAHRPAIDGLRAIAVVAVLLYHGAQLTGDPLDVAPGGFLGVDLFMVLSGYLITTLLLLEWTGTRTIRLATFYRRRARRLLPALLLVLAAVSAAFLVGDLFDAGQRQAFPGDALASLLYVANWRFALSGASYFDQFGGPSPLRHMWSLAIEEQFYLVWPLLLLGLVRGLRLSRQALALVLVAGVGASALLMTVLFDPAVDPSRVYYGTDTRAQALLLGALLAVVLLRVPAERLAGGAVQGAAAAGLGGCLVLFVVATDDPTTTGWLYRGGFLVVAGFAALAIAGAATTSATPYALALSSRPLVWLGTISYGLYLWHWPVFVILDSARTGLDGAALLALRLAVSVALAEASYRLVERPVRQGALADARARAVSLAGGALALGVLAVAVITVEPEAGTLETLTDEEIAALDAGPGPTPQAGDTKVLLVGDSVAQSLSYYRGPTPGLAIKTAAIIGCGVARGQLLPIDRPPPPPREQCDTWPDQWQAAIQQFDPDVSVLMIGAWEVVDREVDGERLTVGSDAYARYLRGELELGRRILTQTGKPMVVLTAACTAVTRPGSTSDWAERDDPERVRWVNEVLEGFAEAHPDVDLIDLHGHLCPDGRYVGTLEGVPLTEDGVHYTKQGAPLVWRWLGPQLQAYRPAS